MAKHKKHLSGLSLRERIYEIIVKDWPIHTTGICRKLGFDINISSISKVNYHVKILEKNNQISTKKIDRALVAWPTEIERIRIVHEFMKV